MSDPKASKPDPRERYRGFESVPIDVAVRVGRARMRLAELSQLVPGEILHLDRAVGQAFELIAGGRVLGEVEPLAAEDSVRLKLVAVTEEGEGGAV